VRAAVIPALSLPRGERLRCLLRFGPRVGTFAAMVERIYTKTGDGGETALFGGGRVDKCHPRVEAYGTVDELSASLGWARSLSPPAEIEAILGDLQHLLFELGSQLATPPQRASRGPSVTAEDVRWLEACIDRAETELAPLRTFVLPGGTPLSCALHMARTTCRRAERRVVALRSAEPQTSEMTVVLLNRLSDLLFVLARRANHLAGVTDVPWRSRSQRVKE
jgi:cob(I)alamin adenosyltransferase